jgi:hypothetical protein
MNPRPNGACKKLHSVAGIRLQPHTTGRADTRMDKRSCTHKITATRVMVRGLIERQFAALRSDRPAPSTIPPLRKHGGRRLTCCGARAGRRPFRGRLTLGRRQAERVGSVAQTVSGRGHATEVMVERATNPWSSPASRATIAHCASTSEASLLPSSVRRTASRPPYRTSQPPPTRP